MSAYITTGGTLLEIGCPSKLARETEQQVSVTTTLGGKRKAFIRRGGRRSWSIDVGVASPLEVSTIEAAARHMGPVGWYGPDAVIGNLLSPQASTWDPVPTNAVGSGLVQLPDGSIAPTVAHTGAGGVSVGSSDGSYEAVPVRVGESVTMSGWGRGGIRFSGFWRDASLAPITNFAGPSMTFTGWQWRSTTLTPPAGAAYLSLLLTGGQQYAVPSVTWGTTGAALQGTGCPKALIHSPQHSPLIVSRAAHWTDSAYTITEVG